MPVYMTIMINIIKNRNAIIKQMHRGLKELPMAFPCTHVEPNQWIPIHRTLRDGIMLRVSITSCGSSTCSTPYASISSISLVKNGTVQLSLKPPGANRTGICCKQTEPASVTNSRGHSRDLCCFSSAMKCPAVDDVRCL